jgi:hypothetical protein
MASDAADAARDAGGQEATTLEPPDYALPLREPEPFRPVDENPAKTILDEIEAFDEWACTTGADEPRAAARLKEAEARRETALEPLQPGEYVVGAGGEPIAPTSPDERWLQSEMRDPNRINVQAAMRRAELAHSAGALELGLDFADAAKAENSLDRALCHQLGAAHFIAMKLGERAKLYLQNADWEYFNAEKRLSQAALATKSALAFARVVDAFQRGYTVLLERRNGTPRSVVVKQEVTVVHQHAHVSPTTIIEGGGETR